MQSLLKKIKTIPKSAFHLNDIRKIANMDNASLAVALHRLAARGELIRIVNGMYAIDEASIDWERVAIDLHSPCYLSYEWALAQHGILSQMPYDITLTTTNRTRTIETYGKTFMYHHISQSLYWGFIRDRNILLAEPEKAFLDLAYLSLRGYATFDDSEMNIRLLNKAKVRKYLDVFGNAHLAKKIHAAFRANT